MKSRKHHHDVFAMNRGLSLVLSQHGMRVPGFWKVDMNQRHVCDAELRIIAKALDVAMEWLVGDSDEIKL